MPTLQRHFKPAGALARLPRRFSAFHDAARRLPSPPSEARRGPGPEGFQAAKGRFPREAGFSAGWRLALRSTRRLFYAATVALTAGCSGLMSPTVDLATPEPSPIEVRAMKIAQVERTGFAFCQDCPMATRKTLYLVLDADSDDAAARALARVRDALTRRTPSRARLELVADGQADAEAGSVRWVMYAVAGNPRDPDLKAQLRDLVQRHPRSTYRIFGTADSSSAMAQLANELETAGVPEARLGKSVLQREHVPDEILGRSRKQDDGTARDQRLLVIEPAKPQ